MCDNASRPSDQDPSEADDDFSMLELIERTAFHGALREESEHEVEAMEFQESEAALRKILRENSQLATAVANLTSGVTITDPNLPDNPIIFANAGFYAITGYSDS